jgi:hypothetical protein
LKWPVQNIHISNDNESFRWFNVDCFLFLLSWTCLLPDLTTCEAGTAYLFANTLVHPQFRWCFFVFCCFCFVFVGEIRVAHGLSVLWYVCLLFFYSFVFVLMCPMVPVSLHYLFLIALRFSLSFIYHDN